MNNLKIHISENAEKALFNMIKHSEYDCLFIKLSQNCIKSLELIIDHKENYKNCQFIGKISICYNDEIENILDELFLKYEKDTFLLKIITKKTNNNSCKNCKSSCKQKLDKPN